MGKTAREAYPDGGKDFCETFTKACPVIPCCGPLRVEDFLTLHPPERKRWTISTPRSWIDQNFRIWIGGPERKIKPGTACGALRDFLTKEVAENSALPPEEVESAWGKEIC